MTLSSMDQTVGAKLKDKKILKTILIVSAVFIAMVVLLNWLIKSQQHSRRVNQAGNFNDYYKELSVRCGRLDKKLYDCCFSSLEFMAANKYKLASEIGCDPGFKINTYKCLGSYKWCELPR